MGPAGAADSGEQGGQNGNNGQRRRTTGSIVRLWVWILVVALVVALIVAGCVVAVEFFAIAWIRKRFLHIPYRSSLVFIATGGLISLAIGVGLGASG